mmetsp:Transcript_11249/g.16267  ORF Transcript_11249/g.16267 Transcript_11249/m.16267 type:complete len:161 (-) Transcript_11249:253-735(-)|eukprot:CAMPEP_0184737986 /NCGR_PEP_ID=MMETSP0315-20130426/739_1 /TAXON_ID=101924 /ORGANISM="Rhodosorus marinus, Strain UTEX LB 2760" /LENGTH=160 /DNA_ID=CAMNT_0027205501 /DNA_START=153 /DNA_END=635 /DNA_ORIENTATION=-
MKVKNLLLLALLGLFALSLVTAVIAQDDYEDYDYGDEFDDDVEVVDDIAEASKADGVLDDEVYKTLSKNFEMLNDGAKESFLKKKLDEMIGTDVFDKMKELTDPAYDAVHQATADDYEGELSVFKKLKAEVHDLTSREGELARFLTKIYRMIIPTQKVAE